MGSIPRQVAGVLVFVILGGTGLSAGCAERSSIVLSQAGRTPGERRLELISEQVYWAESDGVFRVLAEIPLPGAGTGRPTYVLYLRFRRMGGTKAPAPMHDVRGFLIQTRGALRGLTPLTEAQVIARAAPAGDRAAWRLRAQLAFDDGSTLDGELLARRESWRLIHFETRTHPADVRVLGDSPVPMMQ